MQRTSYRTSWTQPEGAVAAQILEGRIIDINLQNWTVDFMAQFDQRYFLNVQVASPYLHANQGEGIYVMPDVAAKCLLCIPSDGPPPFILAFLMPMENLSDVATAASPQGTATSAGVRAATTGSTFSGGRTRAKPGDIYMKGRDGAFCILHRGGVLQIGSTELAQRIFIPLGNVVTDISQNYHHYNTGGSINWGVQRGPSVTNPPTSFRQAFRLLANDERATIGVAVGTLKELSGVPGGAGATAILQEGIGQADPLICEVTVAPDEIEADTGLPTGSSTRKATRLQFAFDKAGGAYLWGAGSVVLYAKKKLRLIADDDIDVSTVKNASVSADGVLRLTGKQNVNISGAVVQIGPGNKQVAHVGSLVDIVVTVPIPIVTSAGPGTILSGAMFKGMVSSGEPGVLV